MSARSSAGRFFRAATRSSSSPSTSTTITKTSIFTKAETLNYGAPAPPLMPRKQVLDSELKGFLTTRVTISRTLKIFSLRNLRDHWTISKATLYRYDSPEYRDATREYSRKAYQEYKEEPKGICYKCQESHATHERCTDCTILLHGEIGICNGCIDTRRRKILRESEIVDVTDFFSPQPDALR